MHGCRLNKLKPKTVKGINKKTTQSFKHRENINKFLQGCRKLGIAEHSMFTTADLYESSNKGAVILTLDCLRRGVLGRTEVRYLRLSPRAVSSSNSPTDMRVFTLYTAFCIDVCSP